MTDEERQMNAQGIGRWKMKMEDGRRKIKDE
jgi:hypothetical protein